MPSSTFFANGISRRCSRTRGRPRCRCSPICPTISRFVLALHEGSVVGMATGWAIGTARARARDPAHDRRPRQRGRRARDRARQPGAARRRSSASRTAATSRSSRSSPGRLQGLAGEYPVWVDQPVRAAGRARRDRPRVARGGDRPRAGARRSCRWTTGGGRRRAAAERAAARRVVRAAAADDRPRSRARRAARRRRAPRRSSSGPAPTTPRPGRRSSRSPSGSACPVWQESFGARAGFPQDHPLFAGHLPADRSRLRQTLAPYDVVLVVGAPVFRQYPYVAGPVRRARDARRGRERATRPRCIAARPTSRCSRRRRAVCARARARSCRPAHGAPGGASGRRCAAAAGARRAAVARARLRRAGRAPAARRHRHRGVAVEPARAARRACPAREPLGFLSPAMGGLGFALPARDGSAWRCPTGPSSRSSATARRSTRSRRCGAPRTTASARSS